MFCVSIDASNVIVFFLPLYNFVDHVTTVFCHVILMLGGQKDFRFHSHALLTVNCGMQKMIFKLIFTLKFVLRSKITKPSSKVRDSKIISADVSIF